MLTKKLFLFFLSMVPVIELRGAIPLGMAWGIPMWQTYLISVIGNILPVPIDVYKRQSQGTSQVKVLGRSGLRNVNYRSVAVAIGAAFLLELHILDLRVIVYIADLPVSIDLVALDVIALSLIHI